jgi:hypothetical protein
MSGGDPIQMVVRFLIAVLCAAALLLIVVIASGSELDDTSGKAIGTAAALAAFSLTGVAGTNLARRRPDVGLLGYSSALASLAALVLVSGAIWDIRGGDWNLAGIAIVLAVAGGHASLLLASVRDEDSDAVRLARGGTLLAIAVLSLMAVVEIAADGEEIDPRLFGVVAVVYVLGTLLLPLLRRTAPARSPSASAVELLRNNGHVPVEGPASGVGARGPKQSTYLRAPDGRLVELVVYDHVPDDG